MANKEQNIPTQGMTNDHPMNLKDSQYPLMVNGNIQTDISGPITLTNEHSNILCLQEKFLSGFKLIGSLFVPENSLTYVFLTDGSGQSEIGYITECQYIDTTDTPTQDPCDHCDTVNVEQTPLEKAKPYSECCTYQCISKADCLNFNIDFPIRKPVYKKDNCGGTLYFTDFLNPVRALKLTPENTLDDSIKAIAYYTANCGELDATGLSCEDLSACTCCEPTYVKGCINNIDCDKLRLFPKVSHICITPELISAGGNLKAGVYQLAACYADSNGQRATRTFSCSNPVSVFDAKQVITAKLNYDTDSAIKFKIEDLKPELYHFIDIYVVGTIDRVSTYRKYATIDITSVINGTLEYTLSNFELGTPGTIDDIIQSFPVYETAQEITTVGNTLLLGNLTGPRDLNLQPAIINLSPKVRWQAIQTKENFYANGVNSANFRGYLRDEVYPLGIVFERNNTLDTCVYPLVGREAIASDLFPPPNNNDNFSSDPCQEIVNSAIWQVYNTASDGSGACGAGANIVLCKQLVDTVYCNSYSYHYTVISYTDATGDISGVGLLTGPSGTAEIIEVGELNGNNYIYVQDVTGTFAIGDIIIADGSAVVTQVSLGSNDPKDCYVNEIDASADCSGNYPTPYNDPSIDGTGDCSPNPDVTGWCIDHKVRSLLDVEDPSAKALCVDSTLAGYPTNVSIPYAVLTSSTIKKITNATVLTVTCYDSTGNIANNIPNYPNPSEGLGGVGPFFYPGLQDAPYISNRNRSNAAGILSANNGVCFYYQTPEAAPVGYFFGTNYSALGAETYCYGSGTAACGGTADCGNDAVGGGNIFSVPNTGPHYQPFWYSFNALAITQVISVKLFARISGTLIPTGIMGLSVYDSSGSLIGSAVSDANGAIVFVAGDACHGKNILSIGDTYYIEVYLTADPNGVNFPGLNGSVATPDGKWDCNDKKTLVTYNYAWFSLCVNAPDGRQETVNIPAMYQRQCTYDIYYRQLQVPESGCDWSNFQYGNFAYWESKTKVYPRSTYVDASGNTIPLWGNLCGKPIRHFKFPDCVHLPLHDSNQIGSPSWGRQVTMYPLGWNISTTDVKDALIQAELAGLITTEERKSITGYKLVRGNRVGNKSIAAKGLLYDMWKYNVYQYESGSYSSIPTYYSSYPFNSMDDDYYLTYGQPLNALGQASKTANAFKHPFNKRKNDRFSFLSPDTTFNSPTLGNELKLESVLYGNSLGNFYTVKDHAKYVILSRGGIILIQTLSAFNFAVDFLNFFAEVYKTFQAGVVFTVGTVISTATGVAAFALGAVGNYLRYAKTWQDIIVGFGIPQNFAKYYVGVGNYHSHIAVGNNGNKRRKLVNNFYMLGGNYSISEQGNSLNLNNYKREDSVYLAINSAYPFLYDNSTHILDAGIADNSRYIISQVGITRDILANVASFYSSIKYYVPDQYGELGDIQWLYTGTCRKIDWNQPHQNDELCNPIFGGDTFISRMTQKRKIPFFTDTAVGITGTTDFQYRLLGNITTPAYYFNSVGERAGNGGAINFVPNETNLDAADYKGLYSKGSIYLFSYGIASFLCESDFNLNFRYGTDNRENTFYPAESNLEDWTQEYRVPIALPNTYYYNRDYSKQNKENFFCTQSAIYLNALCLTTYKNRVVNSQPDTDSDFYSDPWRIFLANDYKDFPLENGQLVGVDGVEKEKLVLRFNNTTWVLNAYYTMTTDAGVAQIEASSLFQQKPVEVSKTEIGYGGTQHHAFVTSQFGHFWVDAARSAVFMLPAGEGGLEEISMSLNTFFNNNLPFFILKAFPNYNVDNNYKKIGISMGWDNRFDRLFLTKLDYELKSKWIGKVGEADGEFYFYECGPYHFEGCPPNHSLCAECISKGQKCRCTKIELTDSTYFCNKSWTMAYSPQTKSWISYYSFIPNYYIGHENYFETGINYSQNNVPSELGIWDHLLTNKSFQVFYGNLYPFITDVVVKEQLINKQLQSIEYQADFLRFQNDYDYFYNPGVTFNKMVIWSENRNSGNLELVPQIPGNLAQGTLYPMVNPNSTTILVTRKSNNWRVNQFWDLVRNKYNNVPPMVYNCHPYLKEVNPVAINYNKPTFERNRITSDYIFLRFINDKYSNYKIINKWFLNNTIKSYT